MKIEEVYLYRMTHIKNIPHILEYGITHKNSANANPNFVAIGDVSLIDTRSTKQVSITNGTYNPNAESIILGDFIPFYFGVKMPMLYVVQNGGNFVEKPTKPEDIIYLVCPIKSIINSDKTYYFSDGHATDNFSSFYDKTKKDILPNIIDWTAITTQYWGGQDNLNLKRKKQAEFLILEDLSSDFLIGFVCYNEKAKDKLIALRIEENKIKVKNNCYF